MDLKLLIEATIAAAKEKERLAKLDRTTELHAAEQVEEIEPETEEIEAYVPATKVVELDIEEEIERPGPATKVSYSGLVAKKRKRPELGGRITNDACTDDTGSEPQPSKKTKPSPTATESAKSSVDAKPERLNRFAPPPRVPSKPSGGWKEREVIETSKVPSEWYENISTTGNANKTIGRGDLQTLTYARTLITNCIEAKNRGRDTNPHFDELRKRIHEMEFYTFLKGPLVKKSKVLESDGLLQIFDGPNKRIFPWDIAADAEALWLRWMGGDIDSDVMRGVEVSKGVLENGKKRTSYSLKKEYAEKRSSNTLGTNNLTNGQWWSSRICALRDGAHGAQEAGIHGQNGIGAISVVVAAGGYADRDNGDTIEYCGTASDSSTPTRHTSFMLDSYLKKQSLRVLRAANKKSKYAPEEGIRYDGLYDIIDKEILDLATAMFRFTLKRVRGQDPIRWKGVEARPTDQELKERMKIRELIGC